MLDSVRLPKSRLTPPHLQLLRQRIVDVTLNLCGCAFDDGSDLLLKLECDHDNYRKNENILSRGLAVLVSQKACGFFY